MTTCPSCLLGARLASEYFEEVEPRTASGRIFPLFAPDIKAILDRHPLEGLNALENFSEVLNHVLLHSFDVDPDYLIVGRLDDLQRLLLVAGLAEDISKQPGQGQELCELW